jgi:hypothetical protein
MPLRSVAPQIWVFNRFPHLSGKNAVFVRHFQLREINA